MIDEKLKVSVVIPSYGREALLCRCIEGVLKQDYPSFEVIVLDQTAQHLPATDAFLRSVQDRIRHVKLALPSLMGALNAGLRLAQGDIVWLTDDDVQIPDATLLDRHARAYADPTIGGVAGYEHDPRRPGGSAYDPRSADEIWGWYYARWDHAVRGEVVTAPGANVSFRRDLLVRVGGFDERFTGNAFRWENDLCLRVRRAGYRVVFEPEAKVVHQPSASAGGCENMHLLGREPASHGWYVSYFRNMAYVTLKHMPLGAWPRVLWKLWREHVCNRPFLRMGSRFITQRLCAFTAGIWQGVTAWRDYCRT